MNNNILPFTAVQLDVVWWILRAFCFTSSTLANTIKAFPTIITVGHPLNKSFGIVLKYTHNSFLLPVDGSDGSDNVWDLAM